MSRRRGGRLGYLATILVLFMAGVSAAVVLGDSPPPPVVTPNPGRFTGVAGPGSFYEYLYPDGQPVPLAYFDAGRPSCADEEDNDLDGRTDAQDPECDGQSDANERLDGIQPYTPSSLPVKIKANGVITVRPSDLQVQPAEKCVEGEDGPWCLLISPRGAGPARRGSIEGHRITLPIPMTIKFDAVTGYPGFDPRCEVGYTENVYVGEDYDPETGVVVLETDADNAAPAATDCGEWTDAINSAIGLPGVGHSKLVITLRNEVGETPQLG